MFEPTDIPLRLRDPTLRAPSQAYLFCILLRVSLGLALILYNKWLTEKGRWVSWAVMGILAFTAIAFLRKYFEVRPVWKVYLRFIVMAISAILLIAIGLWKKRPELVAIAGVLILVDILMGIQSRHMASLLPNGK